jgi:hypothetical protein
MQRPAQRADRRTPEHGAGRAWGGPAVGLEKVSQDIKEQNGIAGVQHEVGGMENNRLQAEAFAERPPEQPVERLVALHTFDVGEHPPEYTFGLPEPLVVEEVDVVIPEQEATCEGREEDHRGDQSAESRGESRQAVKG